MLFKVQTLLCCFNTDFQLENLIADGKMTPHQAISISLSVIYKKGEGENHYSDSFPPSLTHVLSYSLPEIKCGGIQRS